MIDSLINLFNFCKFERIISFAIKILNFLFIIQEFEMIRSRDRSSKAKNRRRTTKNVKMKHHIDTKMMKMNHHIDTKVKMKKIIAKKQTFENSTLRAFSQFKRVQIEMIFIHDEMMNSTAKLVVHRADSASNRKRRRDRKRERSRERRRKRRERKQTISK